MLRELGFEKVAGPFWQGVGRFFEKSEVAAPRAGKAVEDLAQKGRNVWDIIHGRQTAAELAKATSKDKSREFRLAQMAHEKSMKNKEVLKSRFGTGLAIGAGTAVVGGVGINALFGKKKQDYYYPGQ